ncbi:sigma 54-interacting transcriptional regulator [Sorangium sp. So ce131]|uniref:sigma 54-interacting transcriptional regulator n=1 Tax=Sorangium sp. So ce131 TaxID=3133282 RepID=UPI003F5F6BF4
MAEDVPRSNRPRDVRTEATTEEKAPAILRGLTQVFRLRLVYSREGVLRPPAVFTPSRGATQMGRDVRSGIPLPRDGRASRLHATLHADALGRLRVVDEKSRNGTHVNGRRVEEALLQDGDVLSIGDSYFVVRAEAERQADAPVPSLLGDAPSIHALRAAIHRVGPTAVTVLLLAESGCGKEVVARAVHDASRRRGPFVAVNCSAIPEGLAESQLFGHLANAFSGAVARPGLFRAAEGGTLFLDEVGDLPQAVQPKLLRVLQDRMVLPLGATAPVACDVRIVAATNRDLKVDVAAHRFRGDLFARLSEFPLGIPPLRERREDILPLLEHALGAPRPRISAALAEALLLHPWPFNVRELFALAAQLRIRGGDAEVLDLDLVADRLEPAPGHAAAAPQDEAAAAPRATAGGRPAPADRRPPAEEEEDRSDADEREPPPGREQLEELLRAHRGVVADIARTMRRSRKQIYRWISHHGLDVQRFRG